MKLRLLCLSLICCVSLAGIASAVSIDPIVYDQKFSDVGVGDVEIVYLYDRGIIKGHPDNTVKSNDPLTRAEVVTVFARYFDLDAVYDPSCTFPDVESDVWYAGYVSALCNEGLVEGYPDGTFQAANNLTRAEALAMLARGVGFDETQELSGIPADVDPDAWFVPYAAYAKEHNLFEGSQVEFNAGNSYTRSDIFENIYRHALLEELGESYYELSMDPAIITTLSNKSSNVGFYISSAMPDYSTTFNNMRTTSIDTTDMDYTNTYWTGVYDDSYKNVAYNFGNMFYYTPLKLSMPFEFDKTLSDVRRVDEIPNAHAEDAVKDFFSAFGLNMTNVDINSNMSQTEIDTVEAEILDLDSTYDTIIGDTVMSFEVVDPNNISFRLHNYCNGQYFWFEGKDPVHDNNFERGVSHFEFQNASINDENDNNIGIDRVIVDCQMIQGVNSQGNQYISDYIAFYDIELNDTLVDGVEYTLSIPPTIFTKVVDTNYGHSQGLPWGSGIADRNVILPTTTITFENNSALEYSHPGEMNNTLDGVAIIGETVYSWPGAELYAVPYDVNDIPFDFAYTDMIWTVLDGDAYVTDEGTYHKINFGTVGEVELMVEYKGFTDTKTVYYNAGQTI